MDKLLTVQETAEFLSIHKKSIYKLISQKRIPYIRKPGIGYRFRYSDLKRWLEEDLEAPSGWKNIFS